MQINYNGYLWSVLTNRGSSLTYHKDQPNTVHAVFNPELLAEIAAKFNKNWSKESIVQRTGWNELQLWRLFKETDDASGGKRKLYSCESFKDSQYFELAYTFRLDKGLMPAQAGCFLFFAVLGIVPVAGAFVGPSGLGESIVALLFGLTVIVFTFVYLTFIFGKSVVLQDESLIIINQKYLWGLIQKVRSFKRSEINSFQLNGKGLYIMNVQDEPVFLLKETNDTSSLYEYEALNFVCTEANRFWDLEGQDFFIPEYI